MPFAENSPELLEAFAEAGIQFSFAVNGFQPAAAGTEAYPKGINGQFETMQFVLSKDFFVIFDCLAIFLTGLIGVSAVVRCCADGKTSKSFTIVNGFLQFVFCADVVSSVVVFIKSKPIK